MLVISKMTVIQPQGSINAANALDFEQQLITAVASDNCESLIVDLELVESLDSAGLMALISCSKVAQRLGRHFGLRSVSPTLKIIFELTQLDQVFDLVPSRA